MPVTRDTIDRLRERIEAKQARLDDLGEIKDLPQFDTLRQDIEDLRAILELVEKLPVTANGVPISLGMNLYSPMADYDFGVLAIRCDPDDPELECRDVRGVEFRLHARDCYSTALAARSTTGQRDEKGGS